jgi:hypothetical protein
MNKIREKILKICCYLIFACILVFPSCISIKPATSKSGKSSYESFFLENGNEQFYIKPILFKGEHNRLLVDFTLRTSGDECVANFSISGSEILEKPDSVVISNAQCSIQLTDINRLYTEVNKSCYQTRYTSKLQVSDLLKLMEHNLWNISYYSGSDSEFFVLRKTNIKKLERLKPVILESFIRDVH